MLVVVKPQDVPALLEEIAPAVDPDATVVSLAAGIRIATVESALPDGIAVVRAMPNTPALVGEGMFGISPGSSCTGEQLLQVRELLANGGKVVVVDESGQDAVTAVSGSGPAYVFYLAEAMVDGGVEAGLDAETARILATQTLVGAAKLLATSDDDAAELRRRVTSPNGTTAAAIEAFDERDVHDALVAGVWPPPDALQSSPAAPRLSACPNAPHSSSTRASSTTTSDRRTRWRRSGSPSRSGSPASSG